MKRSILPFIKKDLPQKIVFVTGPRQAGKTTLAKSIAENYDYFNYDLAEHRIALRKLIWNRNVDLLIFDELHKMPKWKTWLKGIFDTEGVEPPILVTGSAKLNTYRKVGDSMAGRYFQYRLHPLDLKEAKTLFSSEEIFERLWNCSGFPEPFLKGDKNYYKRWRRTHTDIILRQDLLDIQSVKDIQAIEDLLILLQDNVGSTVSYANLARALEKDAKTIKRWLQLLEDLYIIFKVPPYSKNIARSLLKEPKYYFYDYVQVSKNEGVKLENMVASALLKELHYIEDVYGVNANLFFLRNKEGHEVDFLIVVDNIPRCMIEVKWSDDIAHKSFENFSSFLPPMNQVQLVKELKKAKSSPNGLLIQPAISWLSNIDFSGYC